MAGTRMTLTDEYLEALKKRKASGVTREGFAGGAPPTDISELNPDDVAPLAVFLASDAADDVNGQVLFIGGSKISYVQPPRPIKTIYKPSNWTVDELIQAVPGTLMDGVPNPAPPAEPVKNYERRCRQSRGAFNG